MKTAVMTILIAVVLTMTGCTSRTQVGPGPAPVVSTPLGAFRADLLLFVKEHDGGRLSLRLTLAKNDRGLIRARIVKVDHTIAEIAAGGGQLDCWLPRATAVSATLVVWFAAGMRIVLATCPKKRRRRRRMRHGGVDVLVGPWAEPPALVVRVR